MAVGLTTGRRTAALPSLAILAGAGLGWVFLAPEVATALPYGSRPEPNASQLAFTALGLILFTGAYGWTTRPADRSLAWALTWGYCSAIVVIKFILSPAAYRNTPTTTLGEFVWVGLVAMVFYLLGLLVVYAAGASRRPAKVVVVAALVVLAVGARWVAAIVLGAGGDEYFHHVYRGAGLILPILVAGTAWLAVEAFDRAPDRRRALRDGFALVVLYHLLWVVFMVRLFD